MLKHDFRYKENSVQQCYKRALTAHAESNNKVNTQLTRQAKQRNNHVNIFATDLQQANFNNTYGKKQRLLYVLKHLLVNYSIVRLHPRSPTVPKHFVLIDDLACKQSSKRVQK